MHFHDAPMLPGGALFGHMPELRNQPLRLFERLAERGDDVVRLRASPGPVIGVVSGPELLHELLVTRAKSFDKPAVVLAAVAPLAGKGLFSSEGELWRRQRRLMAPLFQERAIERYAACMTGSAARAAASFGDGATIDVAREMTRITMDVAGRALFDADTFDEADEIGDAIATAIRWVDQETSSFQLILRVTLAQRLDRAKEGLPGRAGVAAGSLADALREPLFLPGERSAKMRAALGLLDRRVERMIADRRDAGLGREDLLTRLLAARDEDGDRMSDVQVRDELITLFIAGHETTATALAWSFASIGRDEEIRSRLRDEVDALGGRPVTAADLPRLGYAQRVFKEALRVYPPLYLFARHALEDVRVGDIDVARDTVLLVSPYVTHHRRDLWPDPARFDPDRFLPDAEAARPRYAWLPFGAGPRTCIGNHFALMEGPIVLATLLQQVDFELLGRDPIEPEPVATLRPKGGVPARVRRRAA